MLVVGCRFVAHDQWLTTHVDPEWKVRQLKLCILAKCLALPVDPAPDVPRPRSPITFAPDRPPVSPIRFAATAHDDDPAEPDTEPDDRPVYRPPPPPPPPPPSHPAPAAYTLIRFSTGQALEDDLALTFFNLAPYELLELHAHADPAPSPAHTRASSLSTLAPAPAPAPPRRIYLAPLDRADLRRYIAAYWEGPVRELRSVPARAFLAPIPSYHNGYGYGYAGADPTHRIGPPPLLRPAAAAEPEAAVPHSAARIEWRARHVVIRDERFMLYTRREDPNPRHVVPLEAFTALMGPAMLLSNLRSRPKARPRRKPKRNRNRKHRRTRKPDDSASAPDDTDDSGNASDSDSSRDEAPAPAVEAEAPRTIAGSRVDDLRIVVLRFRSTDCAVRAASTSTATATGASTSAAPKLRNPRSHSRSKPKLKPKPKPKPKGRPFPWDAKPRDKDKDKDKKARDWIPGFSVRRERGLGSGAGGGAYVYPRPREDTPPDPDADADPDTDTKITFARRSEADASDPASASAYRSRSRSGSASGSGSGSGSGAEEMEEDGTVEDGEGAEECAAAQGVRAGKDKDKGKGRADRPTHSHGTHPFPFPTLTGAGAGGGASDTDTDSDTWSSPVFAHSDTAPHRSAAAEDADEWNDDDDDDAWDEGEHAHVYRYGYRYGYQGPVRKRGTQAAELGPRERGLKTPEPAPARVDAPVDADARTESIILDLVTDCAYKSFLRVLHRHLAAGATSEFVPTAPVSASATAVGTGTGTGTGTPTPTTPTATGTATHAQSPSRSRTASSAENEGEGEEEAEAEAESTLAASRVSPASSESASFPQHPAALRRGRSRSRSRSRSREKWKGKGKASRAGKGSAAQLGVLPYPEWRLELTERAVRAGVGDVGRAMRWVMWGSRAQLGLGLDVELDEQILRRRRRGRASDGDGSDGASMGKMKRGATSLESRRRSTASAVYEEATSLKSRRRSTASASAVYDSDVSGETGRMLEMSDSGEGSEAEWYGWPADLQRQRLVRECSAREEAQRRAAAPVVPVEHLEGEPADAAGVRSRRAMLEPTGVISARYPDAGAGAHEGPGWAVSQRTSSGLHSPSSSDSLRRAAFSPFDYRSSSPAGTFSNPHNSRGSSLSPSPLGARTRVLPAGAGLAHSTSMYASIRPGAHAAEQPLRRPSMPILSSDYPPQTALPAAAAAAAKFAFPHSPPFSLPADEEPAEPSPAASRRGSHAGLGGAGAGAGAGGVGRSPSVLARGRGALLRRDAAREAERAREKERRREEKAREREERERVREEERGARRMRRPKLSLATSASASASAASAQRLVGGAGAGAGAGAAGPSGSELGGRELVRRVKSGSNLGEGSSVAGERSAMQKKKWFVNRIVSKLDSAMDFVDGL